MTPAAPTDPDRFKPNAHREMASMFDDVSGRYDLLNRLMTLGQDGIWREALWAAVPEDAAVVLDLCTGSGVSLPGLRRPGRTVLGVDVSLAMLEHAQSTQTSLGWAPRIVCADGFQLPLRDGAVGALTVAFGVRNLRPRPAALAEMARVLAAGGTLAVLEAAAPAPGPFAAIHAAYVRHGIPALGRLSPDPSAYRYLSESIFEFGAGPEFERELNSAGFEVTERRSFMLGATRLWVARRGPAGGEKPTTDPHIVHSARPASGGPSVARAGRAGLNAERLAWDGAQFAVAAALAGALMWGLATFQKYNATLDLQPWQKSATGWLLLAGAVGFGIRALALGLRVFGRLAGR